MKVAASIYTFLIFNFRVCFSNMNNFQQTAHAHKDVNCTNCRDVEREIEYIKQMELIKREIMRRLNISAEKEADLEKEKKTTTTTTTTATPKSVPEVANGYEYRARGADILRSYSEPADNFTDENIVQFRLGDMTGARRRILVNSANLLVLVKYKRRKKRHNDIFRPKRNILKNNGTKTKTAKKKNRRKAVDLKLFTVNAKGKPDAVITSVTSTLKKTKWLKLSLPRNIVQNAIDSSNNTLQVYITCRGCGKRANIILVHKRKKRRRNKQRRRSLKLHKRRPMLITRVTQLEKDNREKVLKEKAKETRKDQLKSHKSKNVAGKAPRYKRYRT